MQNYSDVMFKIESLNFQLGDTRFFGIRLALVRFHGASGASPSSFRLAFRRVAVAIGSLGSHDFTCVQQLSMGQMGHVSWLF